MITLTREEAQQVLDALQCATPPTFSAKIVEDWQSAVEFLRARLSAPEQEPVAGYRWEEGRIPLSVTFAAPAQREWQGLTDEEILEEYRQSYGDDGNLTDVYFARAIEAKLKEKNT